MTTELALRSYGDAPLTHSHPFHQFVLALEGVLEMEIGGRGGRVDAAVLAAIAPGQRYSCRAAGRNRFLILDWDSAVPVGGAAERLLSTSERRSYLELDPRLFPLLRFLGSTVADDGIAADERRDWARLLLRRLGDGIDRRSTGYPRRLGRALAFIEGRAAAPLTVGRIAAAAHTSAGHLHELFRRHLGRSPMRHVAALRLERAMELLAGTDLPIAEVAVAAGYADQSSLTRALKRRRGVTPARYRKSRRRCGAAGAPDAGSKRPQPR